MLSEIRTTFFARISEDIGTIGRPTGGQSSNTEQNELRRYSSIPGSYGRKPLDHEEDFCLSLDLLRSYSCMAGRQLARKTMSVSDNLTDILAVYVYT